MKTATGKTFEAKSYLKECGAKWDAEKKAWTIDESFDMDRWEKLCRISYNARAAKVCQHVEFV